MPEHTNEIYARCQCDYYDLTALHVHLTTSHTIDKHRNALALQWHGGEAFIFDYGVTVFWSVPHDKQVILLEILHDFSHQPLTNILHDEFTYEQDSAHTSLKNDHICLPADEPLLRIAV